MKEIQTMGHFLRDFMTYASAWLAMVAMLVGTFFALRAKRRERRTLFAEDAVLHAHFDVIHAHVKGDVDHLHDAAGQSVTIRR
jgi:hypothetical protein